MVTHLDDTPASIDMSRRIVGIAVAVLACLLNYSLLSGVAYWMLAQIKTSHDPYNIDELVLSPFILRSNGWTPLHLAAARGDLTLATMLLALSSKKTPSTRPLLPSTRRWSSIPLSLMHMAQPPGSTCNVTGGIRPWPCGIDC